MKTPILDAMTDKWLMEAQAGIRAKLPDDSGVAQIALVLLTAVVEAKERIDLLDTACRIMASDYCEDEESEGDLDDFLANLIASHSTASG